MNDYNALITGKEDRFYQKKSVETTQTPTDDTTYKQTNKTEAGTI